MFGFDFDRQGQHRGGEMLREGERELETQRMRAGGRACEGALQGAGERGQPTRDRTKREGASAGLCKMAGLAWLLAVEQGGRKLVEIEGCGCRQS